MSSDLIVNCLPHLFTEKSPQSIRALRGRRAPRPTCTERVGAGVKKRVPSNETKEMLQREHGSMFVRIDVATTSRRALAASVKGAWVFRRAGEA